ncbi:MAG TPA: hypothetical protein VGD95_02885 [Micavibrio sp.]
MHVVSTGQLSGLFKRVAIGAAVLTLGAAGYALFDNDQAQGADAGQVASWATLTHTKALSVAQFKSHVDQYSRGNMMVVLWRRQDCARCPAVRSALEEARYQFHDKYGRGFTVYELNADHNPAVAGLLRPRAPAADARLHVFYNGEKIFESAGISDNPQHIVETLTMVQALADGGVSAYDKYHRVDIFAP